MTDLDARYGHRPSREHGRRTALLAWGGVALAVVAVALFAWSWAAAQDPFAGRVHSYDVVSDIQANASIEVTNKGTDTVRCEAIAQDRFTQAVGAATVEAPPGPEVTLVPVTLTTTGRAVTVVVRDCVAVAPRVP